ncbi:unnamed protein product, partial [Ectocarpus sp. 12 AP-2014]
INTLAPPGSQWHLETLTCTRCWILVYLEGVNVKPRNCQIILAPDDSKTLTTKEKMYTVHTRTTHHVPHMPHNSHTTNHQRSLMGTSSRRYQSCEVACTPPPFPMRTEDPIIICGSLASCCVPVGYLLLALTHGPLVSPS